MRRRKTNRRDCKFVLEENNSFPSQGKDRLFHSQDLPIYTTCCCCKFGSIEFVSIIRIFGKMRKNGKVGESSEKDERESRSKRDDSVLRAVSEMVNGIRVEFKYWEGELSD